MIKTVRDAWQIPELRRKILFTIFALLIFRLGAAIPVPYINTSGLETYLSAQSGGEGKSPVGRPGPVTPWGKPALGYKTRKTKNRTDKFIVKRRNAK